MIAENHDRFPGRLFLFYDLAGRATSERLQGGVSWPNRKAEKLARIADEGGAQHRFWTLVRAAKLLFGSWV